MHDFMLAKEISEELIKIAKEKKISKIKAVSIEIGVISMKHDGHPEHTEDINLENLQFGLESLLKETPYKDASFRLDKTQKNAWQIVSVEV